jgi:hypothetical protein
MNIEALEGQWNSYLAAYGPVTAEDRERLLRQSVSERVIFTNPGGQGETLLGLIAHIEDFQRKMPGMYFGTDKLFLHHGEVLAVWSMYKAENIKVATGYNFVRLDEEGRFSYMAGFF